MALPARKLSAGRVNETQTTIEEVAMKKNPFAILEQLYRAEVRFGNGNFLSRYAYHPQDSSGVGNYCCPVPRSERQYDGWNMETDDQPWILA